MAAHLDARYDARTVHEFDEVRLAMVPQLVSREGWQAWEREMLKFIRSEKFDNLSSHIYKSLPPNVQAKFSSNSTTWSLAGKAGKNRLVPASCTGSTTLPEVGSVAKERTCTNAWYFYETSTDIRTTIC